MLYHMWYNLVHEFLPFSLLVCNNNNNNNNKILFLMWEMNKAQETTFPQTCL